MENDDKRVRKNRKISKDTESDRSLSLIHIYAANFILERREAGDKITIPIWRGLPENEAEAAEYVVLIPFISDEENRPAILICPDWENGRQRMMDEGMKMAKTIFELGCQAFILNRCVYETDLRYWLYGEEKPSYRL